MSKCPNEDSGYHMWEVDGPFTVTCSLCGADGRIVLTAQEEHTKPLFYVSGVLDDRGATGA